MIQIVLNAATKKSIEQIHWNWFKFRVMQLKFSFFPFPTYYSYIKKHVVFFDSSEKKLSTSQKRRLFYKRLKNLVVGEFSETGENSFIRFINLNGKKKGLEKKRLLIAFGYDDFSMMPGHSKWTTWYNKNKLWYDRFKASNNGEDWNTKVLCEKLGVDVCPYCNRQYIYTYERDNVGKKNTAEIDHFKPKSKYPYFSCSLYNMIPSCGICNSIKRDDDRDIVYPYKESFEKKNILDKNFAFFRMRRKDKVPFKTTNVYRIPKTIKLDVVGSGIPKSRMDNSKEMFALEELYSRHELDLNDLLLRYSLYGKLNIRALSQLLKTPEALIKKVILGIPLQIGTKKEFVLRKFKEDITRQLDDAAEN